MWLDWRKGEDFDSMAVVKMPRGFARMNCCSLRMSCSACTARRYMVGVDGAETLLVWDCYLRAGIRMNAIRRFVCEGDLNISIVSQLGSPRYPGLHRLIRW